MSRAAAIVLCVLAAALWARASHAALADHAKLSPFTNVEWADAKPRVEFEGRTYEPLAIAGQPVVMILDFCRGKYGRRAEKRFAEDLVQVLTEMGHAPGRRVDLRLRDVVTGEVVEREGVEMTEANRRAVLLRNMEREGRAPNERADARPEPRREVQRVDRPHSGEIADEDRNLVKRIREDAGDAAGPRLPRARAEEDLDELEWLLGDRFSYLTVKGVEYRRGLDSIRAALGDGIGIEDFRIQLAKLVARFGDGHSRVRGVSGVLPAGHLPFALGDANGGVVACVSSRRRFLDVKHPYLVSLDGVEVETWVDAARVLAPDGSAQLARRAAIERLGHTAWLRRELDREESPFVDVVLRDAAGESTVELTTRLAPQQFLPPMEWLTVDRRLVGDIGYLRVPSFRSRDDPNHVDKCVRALRRFRDTTGLIIDVRDNGGGGREALLAIYPFLAPPGAGPRVVNTAAYRSSAAFGRDHLEPRFMRRRDDPRWSPRERAAIDAFAAGFVPEWPLPAGDFSAWHYLMVEGGAGDDVFFYDRPVVILQNEGCFSATDIFLGAFEDLTNVALIGTASGGGSGRSVQAVLTHSGVPVRLSSMASYRPNGKLYEGSGVPPDVVVERVASDVVGKTDTQLEAALRFLANR